MINQTFSGTPTSKRFAACPTTVKGGDPVLLGSVPAVAMTAYQAVSGGAVFQCGGSYALSVSAVSTISPQTGKAIKAGDPIYLDGGTLDSATNVTTGGTLDANSSNTTLFGYLDPTAATIATTVTNAAANVLLGRGM